MAKRLVLPTRGFGAEPGQPDVTALAAWIAEHRGRTADIVTYQLDRSLAPQVSAGIGTPCAGGKFYAERIRQCLAGVADKRARGELHLDAAAIIEDAAGIVVQKKGAWCAIPAPHVLGLRDEYYHDAAEWSDAICGMYRTMMRTMRDTGVPAHVLVCDTMEVSELAALARPNVFFFSPETDRQNFANLMEFQHQVAVGKDRLQAVFDLTDEYTLRKIFIIDPDPAAIRLARSHLDPDQIVAGGYCTEGCGEYWEKIVAHAVYEK